MSIIFAAAVSHAPGWVAWRERAPEEQRDALGAAATKLKAELETLRPDTIICLTSEHWTNFFLDHVSAFCVGLGESAVGPVEPWMKMDKTPVPGDPELAKDILTATYASGLEPSFSHELILDHGTIVPLSFLTPKFQTPVAPVFFNTLAPPLPSPARCYALGQAIGGVARKSPKRLAIIATGGMSHDPGERGHGLIDTDFDQRFLDEMARGDGERLRSYSADDLSAKGAGTPELLAWIALAGALGSFRGEVLAYEAVRGWATGMGIMRLAPSEEQ